MKTQLLNFIQKKSFLVIVTLITFQFKGQIVNIPDQNFKNALISLGIDTNNDGEIQLSEAQAVTSLNLQQKDISDLTGIKSFSNLTALYCGRNHLTNVDLSNMVTLRDAYLLKNNLININLDGCTNLKFLYLQDNQFSSINLAGLINLQYINLDGNEFANLEISNLPSLQRLSFMYNRVPSTISFNAVPNIQYLYLSNSNLTSINLVGVESLKHLNCRYNQLDALFFQDGFVQNFSIYAEGNPMQFICKDSYDLFSTTPSSIPQLTGGCVLSTVEGDKEQNKISINPNPVKEIINLNQKVEQIKIFTTDGKIVFTKNKNRDLNIKVSHLPAGVYILTTEKGNSKFIKE